ncbi:MAG: flagellar protein FliS [Clostridia bacterium]|jgi:flagellar protein FliS|nr:flagellar protein FliS [Clostridia bacterium]
MVNPYQQYKENSILTASPGELTLMLYNGAIKFCNQAEEAIEKKDVEASHMYIVRTQDIIDELELTLDIKYPISQEMAKLYDFIRTLLVDANIKKDAAKVKEARELIKEFRDVWQEVIKGKNKVG